jgi:hypothetical protein
VLNSAGCADGAWYLDANAGLAPMSPFRVVSVNDCQYPALIEPASPFLTPCQPEACAYCGIWDSRYEKGEVVPDGVTGSETDPLWDWSVLLLGSGELDLCSEGLMALEEEDVSFLVSI